MQGKPNIWQIPHLPFQGKTYSSLSTVALSARASWLKLRGKRNFRLKHSKDWLPKQPVFFHLCGRCFKLVFEGAVCVLDWKPYRRWEVIIHKDTLSSTEDQQKLSHQPPELAMAVSWEAFSLRTELKNCMWGRSWAWPLFPLLYKSPVCHQARAGAGLCSQGTFTPKSDPSSHPATLQIHRGVGTSSPFSQFRTPGCCLAKRCERQLCPGKLELAAGDSDTPGINSSGNNRNMGIGTGSQSILVKLYVPNSTYTSVHELMRGSKKASPSLFCAILSNKRA